MTRGITITKHVHFGQGRNTRKVLREGSAPTPAAESLGSVPRLSRLMALAIHMQKLVDKGHVADCADLARLAHVTRARMTQIMNLLHLAPDIQEAILFLPPTDGRRAAISEPMLRPIAGSIDWRQQRRMWTMLTGSCSGRSSRVCVESNHGNAGRADAKRSNCADQDEVLLARIEKE